MTPEEIAVEYVICPMCGATPGSECKTRGGNRAHRPHQPRLGPVLIAWGWGYEEGRAD